MAPKKALLFFIFILVCHQSIHAQNNDDPEFTKGFLLLAKMNNGLTTGFKSHTPDMYVGGLGLNPQITVVENLLRVGANAGFIYNNKKMSGMFGPMVALKIKTFGTQYMGSYANLHLIGEANWGTNKQKMAGGGFGAEIFKKLHLGITAQRDYSLNSWWFQTFIALKLNKTSQSDDE